MVVQNARRISSVLQALVDLELADPWVKTYPQAAVRFIKAVLADRLLVEPYPLGRNEDRPEALMMAQLQLIRTLRELNRSELGRQANALSAACGGRVLNCNSISRFERGKYNLKFLDACFIAQVLDIPMVSFSPWHGHDYSSHGGVGALASAYRLELDCDRNPALAHAWQQLDLRGQANRPQAELLLGCHIQRLRKQQNLSRADLLHLVNVQMSLVGAPVVRNATRGSTNANNWGYEIESARRIIVSALQGFAIARVLRVQPEELCPYFVLSEAGSPKRGDGGYSQLGE